jgi:1-acyl-sn-glycerol-3-phosphate acyltransferase
LQEAKMGVAFIAGRSGYPVLPIALTGTEDRGVIANLKKFRRTKIVARGGELFRIDIPRGKRREQALHTATEEIMCRIAALLPEKYRGFYANHPRLNELLEEKTHA